MRKHILITILFLIPFIFSNLSAQEIEHSVFNWEDLAKTEKDSLLMPASIYIDLLAKGNLKDFWNKSHTMFKQSTPESEFLKYKESFQSVSVPYSKMNFIEGKLTQCYDVPAKYVRTFGGNPFIDTGHYLEFHLHPYVALQAILVFEYKKDNIGRFLTMYLGKEDDSYKILNMIFNISEFDGNNAEFYAGKAEEWKTKLNYSIPTAIAYAFAFKTGNYGNVAITNKVMDYQAAYEELTVTPSYIHEFNLWIVNDKRISVLGTDVYDTDDALIPQIIYISNVEFTQENLKKEARQFADKVGSLYPDFAKVFPKIILTAYKENPVDRSKEYDTFSVTVNFTEE